MPAKPRASTPKGVPWDPDIYNILVFVDGLNDLRAKPESTAVPRFVMERLAGLARATDNEIFWAGINFTLKAVHRDFPLLSTPVYRGKLLERMDGVERAASSLRNELQALKMPKDRTTLWASYSIGSEIDIAPYLRDLSTLIEAVRKAKTSWIYPQFAQKKGTPSGAGKSGMALTRFIGHLAFTALAANGRWTLNKNDQSGTLIGGIENLRKFLPSEFLPPTGQHPCSTYQRILSDARSEWNLGQFPWPKLDQK
jgi:hypothetical protein